MDWSVLSNYGVTLFALLNPLGMLPIFVGYTGSERTEVRRIVAFFVAVTVLGLLLIFILVGMTLLRFFGVTLDSFRIAGGILLLGIGIDLVNGKSGVGGKIGMADQAGSNSLVAAKSVYRQIVVPMAMPLLVGPGVIAYVLLYSHQARQDQGGLFLELILVTAIVSTTVFLVLASGKWLQRVLGNTGLNITQRTMGLFVAAMGMQFIVNGVVGVFKSDILTRLSF